MYRAHRRCIGPRWVFLCPDYFLKQHYRPSGSHHHIPIKKLISIIHLEDRHQELISLSPRVIPGENPLTCLQHFAHNIYHSYVPPASYHIDSAKVDHFHNK